MNTIEIIDSKPRGKGTDTSDPESIRQAYLDGARAIQRLTGKKPKLLDAQGCPPWSQIVPGNPHPAWLNEAVANENADTAEILGEQAGACFTRGSQRAVHRRVSRGKSLPRIGATGLVASCKRRGNRRRPEGAPASVGASRVSPPSRAGRCGRSQTTRG